MACHKSFGSVYVTPVMNMKKSNKLIQLNRVDSMERYVLVPGNVNGRRNRRIKELSKVRGNCFFVKGVAHGLFDFIYRATVKLGLKDRKLIFSRGSVKTGNRPVSNRVDIYELDWDLGTSILIPMKLNYRDKVKLIISEIETELRVMEIVVLSGLIQIACPDKSIKWCREMAATVMALGWKQYESGIPAAVKRLEP